LRRIFEKNPDFAEILQNIVYSLQQQILIKMYRRLHFARAVHSHHPNPPIGDAAYHQHDAAGESHRHRQHAQRCGKDHAFGSGDILVDRQADTQTDMLVTILCNLFRGQSN